LISEKLKNVTCEPPSVTKTEKGKMMWGMLFRSKQKPS